MEINIINCFCIIETNSANPVAIVRYFIGNRNEKQALTKKLDLPVTVFLSEIKNGNCNLEFFYPGTEMPLCFTWYDWRRCYIIKRRKIN